MRILVPALILAVLLLDIPAYWIARKRVSHRLPFWARLPLGGYAALLFIH